MRALSKKRMIISLLCICAIAMAGGCNTHRKTNEYSTESDSDAEVQTEADASDEKMEQISEDTDGDVHIGGDAEFTIDQWTQSMKDMGYEETDSSLDGVDLISFKSGDCQAWVAVADTTEAACGQINLTIEKADYASVLSDEAARGVYLDFVRCIVELSGDTYNEDAAVEFISQAEELNGMSYDLSDSVSAYSQIDVDMDSILIRISSR